MADDGSFSATDERLALELASGKTVRDAASAVGISERTAFRRTADTEFAQLVRRLRGEMVGAAIGTLSATMCEAAETLRRLLQNPDPNIQHKAAVKLLELGIRVDEITRIESELAELRALAETDPGRANNHVGSR